MQKFPVSKIIREFSSEFTRNGFSLYIVGGAVRDYLLGVDNDDYDFCTNALPQQVISIFRHVIPTGIKHGTVTVLFKDNSFEVTTFRTESSYSDRRHPDSVSFVGDLATDLSRRDFTINAFAADCHDGKIIDLFNGFEDLKNGIIRAIGEPFRRFSEDALRLMRMCRFCSKLSFRPDDETFNAACTLSETIEGVSKERICDELFKILASESPVTGLRLMEGTGILNVILPEVAQCRNVIQDKVNCPTLLDHLYMTVKASAENRYSLNVRIACLLHDIGKVKTEKTTDGCVVYYGHDIESGKITSEILRRLKCSNDTISVVSLLVSNHMIRYTSSWTNGAVRRFINRVGKKNINSLFELQWCDQIASDGFARLSEYDEFSERIMECSRTALTTKDLKINGNDLSAIGIQRGPEMGRILNCLLEDVLDDPSINNKEALIARALDLFRQC